MQNSVRINKYLAQAGIVTRRSADALISEGKVFINGKKAVLGQQVTERDRIEIRDRNVPAYRYLLYYKPRGTIFESSDQESDVDIRSHMRSEHKIEGVFPVGRLEKDSEGLIMLTDDARVTDRLLNPAHAYEKEYRITVDKKVTSAFLKRMGHGVAIEGYTTLPAVTRLDAKDDHSFYITLIEGKKHQVRRMCAALGYHTVAIRRIRIGPLTLGALRPGEYRSLSAREAHRFTLSLGLRQE